MPIMRASLFAACQSTVFVLTAAVETGSIAQGRWANLTLLPQDRGDESPACLDGSPYGFYFAPSVTGSTKWTIYMQGGGWCYDEKDCLGRAGTSLGSSKDWASTSRGCSCRNMNEDGSTVNDCNCVYMPYGDGASFSGYRAKPWPTPSNRSQVLHFRGVKNFDATMDFAFEHGLDRATEFVLSGSSAGGLATFLHADRAAARLAKQAPNCTLVRAAPEWGYFLDHANAQFSDDNYTAHIKYIYAMQNLSFGADGALSPACKRAFPENPHYCFMSPHMQQFIETPFFMFNSKYDWWQLWNILKTRKWDTPDSQAAVLQYGDDFLEQLAPVLSESKHGAVITSCICHGCRFDQEDQVVLENKTPFQHYADWYFGKTRGAAAIHIDPRKPNGDGTMEGLNPAKCKAFPTGQAMV